MCIQRDPQKAQEGIDNSLLDYDSSKTSITVSVAGAYLALIPVASKICAKGSLAERMLVPAFRLGCNVFLGQSGSDSDPREGMRLLVFATGFSALIAYAITPALSVCGQSMIGKGYKNKEPRSGKLNLKGKARRLVSTHENLLETFPVLAIAAAFSAALAPPTSTSDPLLTRILLHVFLKSFIYIPAYVFNVDLLRTASHNLAIGSAVGAVWEVLARL
ncbi:hypothetical protein FRC02_005703 [Tulasnella sp. 418]|nr:hypothetical protein FRC02_005703 [Tulasnella sp. 418]